MEILNRVNYVMSGEEGASNIEIIIWIAVVLVIATALFLFRDAIKSFLGKATGSVDGLQVK